jgi:uroporphyrinogen-III synthase
MTAALEGLGARVTPFAIYRRDLPEDLTPLREAARRLAARGVDVVLLTPSIQLDRFSGLRQNRVLRPKFAHCSRNMRWWHPPDPS